MLRFFFLIVSCPSIVKASKRGSTTKREKLWLLDSVTPLLPSPPLVRLSSLGHDVNECSFPLGFMVFGGIVKENNAMRVSNELWLFISRTMLLRTM